MRNDTTTQITITMNNVDHASKLFDALNKFFMGSSCGGDCHLLLGDGYGWTSDKGFIGHDVRKPKMELIFLPEDE